ncbi:MAG: D-2-hydroxyacid dehydrogenase family protein [Alphaproteobacteria bacterium]
MRAAVLDDYQGAALSLADWASLSPAVETTFFRDTLAELDKLAARLAGFEIIVAMRERTAFPQALLERLPKLKLLITTGKRNASIDIKAAAARGITVCGTDMLPYPTAELTWGLIIALARNIPREVAGMRAGGWQTTVGMGLKGKTLGLLGLGNLGSQVARVGIAFGMAAIAWSQNLTVERAQAVGATLVSKEELFRRADVVSVHLVLSGRSRGLVGAPELKLMKRSAYLVNTSRGPIVDSKALMAALEGGHIAGAALDVYDEEPLPADHALRRLKNAVLTPHLGYVTAETYRLAYGGAVEDIRAFLDGKPVRVLSAG